MAHPEWVSSADTDPDQALKTRRAFLERYADAYRIQLDKFLRAAGGEEIALPSGYDGLRALEIANAAQQSHATATPIRV